MLVQFSVSNFSSFKEETLLNMIPAKSRTMKEHIIKDKHVKYTEVLPLVTVYGANASGKTNLVNAIAFMRKKILNGTRPDSITGIIPYKLDKDSEQKPSRFEITFKHEGILYTYGFVMSVTTVLEEWLFGYYSIQESKIFERITEENATKVEAGNKLIADAGSADFIKFISKGTRPNQLFLTEAREKNIKILQPVIHWFNDHLQIIRPNSQYNLLNLRAHKDHNFVDYLSKFLHIADTGINKIICKNEEFDPKKHFPTTMPENIREMIKEDLNSPDNKQILIQTPESTLTLIKDNTTNGNPPIVSHLKTEHTRSDGSSVFFETNEESDGTLRLMNLAPMLTEIWEQDKVFIIDELDRSLHTHLSRLFIQFCIAGVIKKKAKGQFIMTTHDTNLLDRSLLRKDEILFIEKDKNGASHLTSLAEYRVSDGLNYENGYLNGRFGAIPFVGSINELLN